MRIGELARRSGLAATALRYYEQLGLLPEPERTASGYRAYGEAAVDRLAFIHSAQAVGLTLAEIRDVVRIREAGAAPCRHVIDLIARRRTEVRERIGELQRLQRELDRVAARADRIDPADCLPNGICAVIPLDALGSRVQTKPPVS